MTQKNSAPQGAQETTKTDLNNTASEAAALNEIVVRRTDGLLVVDSRTIASEFGREHKNVLRALDSLIADGTIDRLNFEPIWYVDEMNRSQRAIQLNEEAALTATPFIGGRRSREGQKRIVAAFLHFRELAARPSALDLSDPATLLSLLQTHAGSALQLQQQVAILEPKAQALDRLGAADGSMCVTDAAKSLKVQPKSLFGWLVAHQWIYRRGATWIAYQETITRGLLEHKVSTIYRDDGTEKAATQVRVTAKGLALLARKVPKAAA